MVVALMVLAVSIGALLLDWRTGSLNTSLCMLLLGLILRRSQDADPGERTMPSSAIRALGSSGSFCRDSPLRAASTCPTPSR
ncbi:hypothetical protein [Actinomyces viscosus]|uniref:hypothetical protein n=1 Tax=Actinomyces viscosus TaxID=1656 RepID=UPI0028E9D07D|nr:hypothetical protein [Actinomyces viscosus]